MKEHSKVKQRQKFTSNRNLTNFYLMHVSYLHNGLLKNTTMKTKNKNIWTKRELQINKTYIITLWIIIAILLMCLCLNSCGSVVKATVSNPQNTAKTTITISTSTPVETTVNPETDAEVTFMPKNK